MLNFGWAEMLVIGVVALIVIGPDDLPDMFRQLGRFTGKLRAMSREFSRAMEQAAKDSGVKDVAKDLRNVTSPKAMGLDAVKSAADKFEKWDPIKNAVKPTSPAALSAKPLTPPPMPPAGVQTTAQAVDDGGEEADDLAEMDLVDVPKTPPAKPVVGPATQALYDRQALKAQVLAEQTAKLKAIDAGTYQPAVAAAKPKRTTKPKVAAAAAPPAPRARKTVKKADPT